MFHSKLTGFFYINESLREYLSSVSEPYQLLHLVIYFFKYIMKF